MLPKDHCSLAHSAVTVVVIVVITVVISSVYVYVDEVCAVMCTDYDTHVCMHVYSDTATLRAHNHLLITCVGTVSTLCTNFERTVHNTMQQLSANTAAV
jgi:hypothetical protein